jgi:hypothetical protein
MILTVEKALEGGYKRSVGESMIAMIQANRINFNSAEGLLTIRGLLTEPQFAKALWGTEPKICTQCDRHHTHNNDCDCGGWPYSGMDHWKWQLQEMVVHKDPIDYIRTTLDGAE